MDAAQARDAYLRWNNAVADAVFPEITDPVPVYLDLEEDVLAAIASAAGQLADAREHLCKVVHHMTVARGRFSLERLWRLQCAWRRAAQTSEPPPTLAFLALTVLAAEDMGNNHDGFDPMNYYSRLSVLLGVSHDSVDVRRDYTRLAEALWGDVNRWLEQLEGLRGLPTAYALTFRYVGLPMSQALVRAGDRRKLPLFFAQYGLAAGMELAPEVLERYLAAWFSSESCPASPSLRRLWARESARERIATVASVELAGWDGAIAAGQVSSAPTLQRVGLMAQIRQGFLGSSLDVALTVRGLDDVEFDGQMEVEATDGEWLPLTLAPAVANLWRTNYTGGIDTASVLEGLVKLRSTQGQTLRHHPRGIVPLVFDELQSAFLEQERLQLNVDCLLLVREYANGRPLAKMVIAELATCARPGFSVEREIQGLAPGWCLVTGVQLFGAPPTSKFNELVPLARDQLTIAGGMRIPSRIRKWSTLSPPEIRTSVESATDLRLVLTDLESEKSLGTWTSDGGALVVSLADASLGVGDYRVALFAGDSKSPLQQATVRLRSAAVVDSGWHLAPRLAYSLSPPGGALGAISATEIHPDAPAEALIDGAFAYGRHAVKGAVHATANPAWSEPCVATSSRQPVQIGSPDPKSCVVTGAHYLEFPPFLGGWQKTYIEGVCRYCGLVKRSPGWAPRPGAATRHHRSSAVIDVASLPTVEVAAGAPWDAALDALMHLGGGSATALASISSQIDGSAIFGAAFPVMLENLGHIAIERRPEGTPLRWEISPTCLAEVSTGLDLIGYWPDTLVRDVMTTLTPLEARLRKSQSDKYPSRHTIVGVDAQTAEAHLGDMVTVAINVTSAMLEALPPLSQIAPKLPREPMPGYVEAEQYDVRSSSWLRTDQIGSPGAYRLVRGFERLHVFRSARDVADGTVTRGSVYLVKHLAANNLGPSLVVYLPQSRSLVLPRGCDLPGLYARAMVMACGELPQLGKVAVGGTARPCLIYREVSQSQVDTLVTLLSR